VLCVDIPSLQKAKTFRDNRRDLSTECEGAIVIMKSKAWAYVLLCCLVEAGEEEDVEENSNLTSVREASARDSEAPTSWCLRFEK
jgi:hypothetical protein